MYDGARQTATYRGEELYVVFSGRSVRNDYGVPGSPVWYQVEDPEILSLKILGLDIEPDSLPAKLINTILELASDLEWSAD